MEVRTVALPSGVLETWNLGLRPNPPPPRLFVFSFVLATPNYYNDKISSAEMSVSFSFILVFLPPLSIPLVMELLTSPQFLSFFKLQYFSAHIIFFSFSWTRIGVLANGNSKREVLFFFFLYLWQELIHTIRVPHTTDHLVSILYFLGISTAKRLYELLYKNPW